MSIPQDQIDPDAAKVVRRLARSGFAAYLVGGCVRDLLLGRKPKDFDVATSATPPEIKALFRNCRIIGRRFRLAHIFFGSKIIETSTFRANPREVEVDDDTALDAETGHGDNELYIRRDNVFGSAEEDARRRDFTINGLFFDVQSAQVIDHVEGLPDLEARLVRTIGDPDVRFREDPVRILRAIKFAARLDFDIDPATYQAILTHKGEIAKCAPPRVLEEIYRLMRGGAARRSLELLQATGVLTVLIPELHRLLGREGDHDGAQRLIRALDALDGLVREGLSPSNALLVCVMVSPFAFDPLYEADGDAREFRDAVSVIEDLAAPIVASMRVSRRDAERARQILVAQRRLMPSRRRRGRPMALVRREWFGDALSLFELMHPGAEGEIGDEISRWHRLGREGEPPPRTASAAAGSSSSGAGAGSSSSSSTGSSSAGSSTSGAAAGGSSAASDSDEPRKRRRRRRGGRRRRRGGSETGSSTDVTDAAGGDRPGSDDDQEDDSDHEDADADIDAVVEAVKASLKAD
ncbi:MAG TPA: polynucleotide adenylyltransferase PcnB [Stellaceae bacterium]|nr:polynucleotide adenylyltransferase PcnB [Stellaceae bacterium]